MKIIVKNVDYAREYARQIVSIVVQRKLIMPLASDVSTASMLVLQAE
jgi:fibrillarin-like rRNA methylase